MNCRFAIALFLMCASTAFGATAPTPPQSIWVTGKTDTGVTLAWYGATAGSSPIASYQVLRDGVQIATPTTATWSDSGLSAATSYAYTIVTVDSVGTTSAVSAVLQTTTQPTGYLGPAAPTGLTIASITATTISLSWTPGAGTPVATGYLVYLNNALAATVPAAAATCALPVLTPGSSVTAKVLAVDAQDNHSAFSGTVSAAVPADTTAPSAPGSVSLIGVTAGTATLQWTAATDDAAIASYSVAWKIGTSTVGTYTTTATDCLLGVESAKLVPNTTYTVVVSAVDTANLKTAAAPITVVTPADTTPPAMPSQPYVMALGFTSVTIGWSDDGDDVAVASWEVYRDGVLLGTKTTRTYADNAIPPGTSCSYTIVAVDGAGNRSSPSLPVTLAVPVEDIPPPAPVAVRITARTASTLTLDWQQDADAGGSGFSYWIVARDGVVLNGHLTSKPFTDSAPTGGAHTYLVTAVDGSGNQSAPSQPMTVVRADDTIPPTVPGTPAASAVTACAAVLTWAAATDTVGVIGYDVYRDGLRVAAVADTTWSESAQVPGSTHAYTVRAYDEAGNRSVMSSPCGVVFLSDSVAPVAPALPTLVAATQTAVTIAWNATTDDVAVAGYAVLRDGVIVAPAVTALTYTDPNLTPHTGHAYAVQAVDTAGNHSPSSPVLTAWTAVDATAPDAPQVPWATAIASHSVTIAWSVADDDVATTSYRVRRNGVLATTTSGLTWTDSGLNDAVSYTYDIVAVDGAGNQSTPSPALSVDTPLDTSLDRTAPSAPTKLVVNARTDTALTIGWTASTDNQTGSNGNISHYHVFRDAVEVGVTSSGSTVTYTDAGLQPCTNYAYTVKAEDAAGNISAASLPGCFTTLVDAVAPSTPTGLTVGTITPTTVALSWTAATDNIGVTAYEIVNAANVAVARATGVSGIVTGLTPGQANTFKVRALDAAGNRSAVSGQVSATTTADTVAPAAPTGVTATAMGMTTVQVSWTAATDDVAVAKYTVRRGSTTVATVTGTTYTDTGCAAGTAYSYTVNAIDLVNHTSAWSTAAPVTTWADAVAPSAPTRLWQTAATLSSVGIAWNGGADNLAVANYRIYRDGTLLTTVAAGTTTYTVNSLAQNTSYGITIASVDAAGNASPMSASLNAATAADTQAPSPPKNPYISSRTSTSVTLVYTAATDTNGGTITGYQVVRDGVVVGTPTSTSYTNTGLSAGVPYAYVIRAVDSGGNVSSDSTPVLVTLGSDATAPSQPGAPTNPAKTGNSLDLAWTASTDNVAVTGYQVLVAGVPVAVVTGTSYTLTGLNPSTSYACKIIALDAASNRSTASTQVSFTTVADTVYPTAPSGLTGTAPQPQSVQLAWSAGADECGIKYYMVFRGSTQVGTTTDLAYLDSSSALVPGQSYDYTVKTVDWANHISATGNPTVTVVTQADTTTPVAPDPVTITATTMTSVSLRWSAATDDGAVLAYELQRDGVAVLTQAGLTATDSGLLAGTTYAYRVVAIDAAGNRSSLTTAVTATTQPDPDPPTVPTNLQLTNRADGGLSISWSPSSDGSGSGIAGYEVLSGGTVVASVSGSPATITGLQPATAYTLSVRAVDKGGNRSPESIPLAVLTQTDTTPPDTPSPTAGTVTYTSGQINLGTGSDNGGPLRVRLLEYNGRVASTTASTFAAMDLEPGIRVLFAISAVDLAGNQSPAAAFWLETPRDTQAPSVPAGIVATSMHRGVVSLTWAPSDDNTGVRSYQLFRNGALLGTTLTPAYTDTTATPGARMDYQILAVDLGGNQSSRSSAQQVLVCADEGAPQRPGRPTIAALSSSAVTLQWVQPHDDQGVTGYTITRDGVSIGTTTSATTWTDTGRRPGDAHVYAVIASDASGQASAPSRGVQVAFPGDADAPTPPIGLEVADEAVDAVGVSWQASTDAGGGSVVAYEVLANEGVVQTVNGCTGRITGLAPASPCTVTVRAVDAAGNRSPASAPLYARSRAAVSGSLPAWNADATVPTTPGDATAVLAGAHTIAVHWSPSTDANGVIGYVVGRRPAAGGAETYLGLASDAGFVDAAVPGNADWVYLIQACDATGNLSTTAATASVRLPADTTKPTAPGSVRMLRQQTIGNWHVIAWDGATDDTGVAAYRVSAMGDLPASARSCLVSASSVSVGAVDFHGNTTYANLSGMTTADTTPPSPVRDLHLTLVRDTRIGLAWAGASDGGVHAISYAIERDGAQLGTATAGTYLDTSVAPGEAHVYTVYAVDPAGLRSPGSTIAATATVDTAAPTAAGTPAWSARTVNGLTLTWPAASDGPGRPAPGYRISRDGDMVGTVAGGIVTWTDTGLQPDRVYQYTIGAVDAAGNVTAGAPVGLRTAASTTPMPCNLRLIAASGSTVTMAWDAPLDVVGLKTYVLAAGSGDAVNVDAASQLQAECDLPSGNLTGGVTVSLFGRDVTSHVTGTAKLILPTRSLSVLVRPPAFDAARWSSDPTFQQAYVGSYDPTRVWQMAEPGSGVPILRSDGGRRIQVLPGTAVTIAVHGAAAAPVTFLATGTGTFADTNTNLITVVADATGRAAATFTQASGETVVLAASPLASQQVRFVVRAQP